MKFINAQFTAAYGTAGQLPASDIPEIVFSGRSNVGKSSLLNKLLNRKSLARVSSTPGKTITINFYRVDDCFFVDLPGYGFARRSHDELVRFSGLMEGYFNMGRRIAAVVQLVDMRRLPTEDDMMMIRFMTEKRLPFIIVLTKSDKLNRTEYKNILEQTKKQLEFLGDGVPIIPFSATKNEGIEPLKASIEKAVNDLRNKQEQE